MFNYISLFSSAGVGCFGFKQNGFDCIATVELHEKRMQIQRNNNKCLNQNGYIVGDLSLEATHNRLDEVVKDYFNQSKSVDIDVLIATPPCQGISVANHKKKDELDRNSLVIESIRATAKYKPKFFIYENVRNFATTACIDTDGNVKTIFEAIRSNLSENYHIELQELNLKNYGSNSSRTRTLVIGVRKDLKDICPLMLFPDFVPEKNLKEVIGHLKPLDNMGDFDESDFFHSFRPYDERMLPWIKATPYGKSAFDNADDSLKPHKIIDGKVVVNQNKNGDKYQRQVWEKVAPCIHTRNDCLASQATIHPVDNRVLSIRELMLIMSIPPDFSWLDEKQAYIAQNGSLAEKQKLRSRTEKSIRECLGEAVPTAVFSSIANKIKAHLSYRPLSNEQIELLIKNNELNNIKNILNFIKRDKHLSIPDLYKVCELANLSREDNAAYHTSFHIAYSSMEMLPSEREFDATITALEPAVGAGIFVYLLAKKYPNKEIEFDCVDIDSNMLAITEALVCKHRLPNIKLKFINEDFVICENLKDRYDIVIGNPPFMKVKGQQLATYRKFHKHSKSSNLFVYFIEKSLKIAKYLVFITPKALLNAPDYLNIRNQMANFKVIHINDFNEKAFDVKIETISFILTKSKDSNENNSVVIYSYLLKKIIYQNQKYITQTIFNSWLLYRNDQFDDICKKLKFGIFDVFRDRFLTKSNTQEIGDIRVIKARNIGKNSLIDIDGYDRYISKDNLADLAVAAYMNRKNTIIVPNLTYNPRAIRLPKNSITDGSAAILSVKKGLNYNITDEDIDYFGSNEFNHFYRIARNYGTRSLNIDSVSVDYFGVQKRHINSKDV